MMRLRGGLVWTALVLSSVLLTPAARAQEAKDYAYLFLQGRIENPSRGTPAVGATVRLIAGDERYESMTDSQGAFVFEKLPVKSFELEVTTADGKVIRGVRQLERIDPDRARLEVSFSHDGGAARHQGDRQEVMIDAGREVIAIGVPSAPANWSRFWKQALVFVGIAGLLAL